MKIRCFAVLLSFVLVLSAVAQDKAPKKADVQNIQGMVKLVKKDTSTITVDADSVQRQVKYSATTKFMVGHSDDSKAGTLDKVQIGNYISCSGPVDKGIMTATDCLYRDKK
jgi:hypothetical protein